MYKEYLNFLKKNLDYEFLKKYLDLDLIKRLNGVSYFCGMDYASKNIYNFKEKISRYDHSLSVALLTYKLTSDKTKSISALFHDVSTPCFSHVIDYMNKDYFFQESTEFLYLDKIKSDYKFNKALINDNLNILDILNFKKYSIVDSERPSMCADRLDGIILNGISWAKNINMTDIVKIIQNMYLETNEFGNEEIAFTDKTVVLKLLTINDIINQLCHSDEDFFMMELLANIIKYSLTKKHFNVDDLFVNSEKTIMSNLSNMSDEKLKYYLQIFKTIKKEDIPQMEKPAIKRRIINPLLNGVRYNS